MNRNLLFDSPFLLGFEHTRSQIERAAKAAAEGYPPYNVEDLGGGALRITLAVAGFTPETSCMWTSVDPNPSVRSGAYPSNRPAECGQRRRNHDTRFQEPPERGPHP